MQKSHGDPHNHKEGHHKPGPIEDAFLIYGRSTQPTSALDEPHPEHLVDDAFIGYGREYNKVSGGFVSSVKD